MSKQIKEEIKNKVTKEIEPTEKQMKDIEEVLKEAKMPVLLTNKDFKLGEMELDVRELNEKNYNQMMFRMQILNVTYQRQLAQSLIDILRLQMIIAKQCGVKDIIKATDDLLTELQEKVKK